MKIASLYLDDMVVIPLGKSVGTDQPRVDLRDASFHAADGWDIRETLPGVFSLVCEGMTEPVVLGGYGYTYVRAHEPLTSDSNVIGLAQGKSRRKQ